VTRLIDSPLLDAGHPWRASSASSASSAPPRSLRDPSAPSALSALSPSQLRDAVEPSPCPLV